MDCKYRRFYWSLGLGLLALIYPVVSVATPPNKITLEYDAQNQELFVNVTHPTHAPRNHYIRKLSVRVNDGPAQDEYFAIQTSGVGLKAVIPLVAREGDRITVKAVCNDAGYKEETLVVPKPE